MKIEQVAIQLFTLRDFCKTAEDLGETFRRIREIGYTAAQVSAVGPIPAEEIRALADAAGVTLCATHEPPQTFIENPQAIVDRLKTLGVTYTAVPSFGVDLKPSNPADVEYLIGKMEAAGKLLRENGQVLTYHNHAFEFAWLEGRPVLEHIYSRSSPENVQAEIDTYWAHFGGADVVALCRKLKGRLPLLHLKDYAIDFESKPYYTEIGYGNLDFRAIIAAAEESGCRWFIVEQDRCPGDPFESITKSFNYIKENLVS